MKKLGLVVLLLLLAVVAWAPGQGAHAQSKPDSVPGNLPNCPQDFLIPGYPVCPHVYGSTTWPQCCQVCVAGSFILLGNQDSCTVIR